VESRKDGPMNKQNEERKVFIVQKPTVCGRCGKELHKSSWIELIGEGGALCMDCSKLGALDFLPAGNAAMTRRSKKYSSLWAVVLKWSRARKRYERQGLLVEPEAMEKAYSECMLDEGVRREKREKAARQRAKSDGEYVDRFAQAIRGIYPDCPAGIERKIAEHACRIYSGRVGRTSMAKELAPLAIQLAVTAHVRHKETDYERLLANGWDRYEALEKVQFRVWEVLNEWGGEKG